MRRVGSALRSKKDAVNVVVDESLSSVHSVQQGRGAEEG